MRRQKWTDIIDHVSSDNIRRLFGQDPDRAAETDEFIQMINRAETDEKLRDEMRAVSSYSYLLPGLFFFPWCAVFAHFPAFFF